MLFFQPKSTVNVLKFQTPKYPKKWYMQTVAPQIRWLLQEQSDQVYTVCHSTEYLYSCFLEYPFYLHLFPGCTSWSELSLFTYVSAILSDQFLLEILGHLPKSMSLTHFRPWWWRVPEELAPPGWRKRRHETDGRQKPSLADIEQRGISTRTWRHNWWTDPSREPSRQPFSLTTNFKSACAQRQVFTAGDLKQGM